MSGPVWFDGDRTSEREALSRLGEPRPTLWWRGHPYMLDGEGEYVEQHHGGDVS